MTHSVVIHALMVSWYPKRRIGNPTGDVMVDHVVEVVKEDHEAPCLMKNPMKPLGMPKEAFGTPNGPNDPLCGHLCLAWLLMV